MKKAINSCILLLLVAGLGACNSKMSQKKYLAYVTDIDNGLKSQTVVGPWEYEIQYKPYNYIIYSENRKGISDEVYRQRLETLKGTAWFNISFKKKGAAQTPLKEGIAGLDEYNSRLTYFSYEARRDITLLYNGQQLQPMSYLFETNYGLTPQETIVVGFRLPEDRDPEDDLQLSFHDRVFGNGIIKATIKAADLQKAAKIEILTQS